MNENRDSKYLKVVNLVYEMELAKKKLFEFSSSSSVEDRLTDSDISKLKDLERELVRTTCYLECYSQEYSSKLDKCEAVMKKLKRIPIIKEIIRKAEQES